jgi:hypothetical protein
MDSEEKEYIENRNLVFIELGKFNVNFEQITHSFKTIIENILLNNGLNNRDYVDCLTGKLTAEPIKSIFQSIISLYIKNENDRKKLNKLVPIFSDLIEIRNIVTHCFWVIGVTVKEIPEPFISGIKPRISKNGVGIYNLNLEIKELSDLNVKLTDFNDRMFELGKEFEKKNKPPTEFELSFIEKLNFKPELNKMKSDFF